MICDDGSSSDEDKDDDKYLNDVRKYYAYHLQSEQVSRSSSSFLLSSRLLDEQLPLL